MASKTLQVRLDDDEYAALQQLADAAGLSMSDLARQTIRLGVASEQMLSMQTYDTQRRVIDRSVARKEFALVAQAVMLLHEIGRKAGITDEQIEEIKADASDYADEHHADGDTLELAIEELQAEALGQVAEGAQNG